MDQEEGHARSRELPCVDEEVAAGWEEVPANHQQIGSYKTAGGTRSECGICFGVEP